MKIPTQISNFRATLEFQRRHYKFHQKYRIFFDCPTFYRVGKSLMRFVFKRKSDKNVTEAGKN